MFDASDAAHHRRDAHTPTATPTRTFDAANQVVGWEYDDAGNLIGDGTTTYAYDALDNGAQPAVRVPIPDP